MRFRGITVWFFILVFLWKMSGHSLRDSMILVLIRWSGDVHGARILFLRQKTNLRNFRIDLAYRISRARDFLRDFLDFLGDFLHVLSVAFVAIDVLRARDFLRVVERLQFGMRCVGVADTRSWRLLLSAVVCISL